MEYVSRAYLGYRRMRTADRRITVVDDGSQEVPEYQLFLSIASTGLVRSKDFHLPREPFK